MTGGDDRNLEGISTMNLARAIAWLFVALVLSWTPAASFAQSVENSAPAASVPVDVDYRLGPGDKVRVIVFGEESLTGEFFVSGAGAIALPLIGEIGVLNKTVGEVQTAIRNALKDGYLNDPRVSLEVLTYRPFYILGEVNKPGTYPYTSGLTVLSAVATAQGFTYRANTRRAFIKRAKEAKEAEVLLNNDVLVQPGDTIRIAERFF